MPNHVFGYSGLRDMNVEFQQFSMNSRCAPQRVGLTHRSNEIPDRWINNGTSRILLAALPGPVQAEPLAMPSQDRLRLHNMENFRPMAPESGDYDPEESIHTSQLWPFGRPGQYRQLLPKEEIFEDELLPSFEDREKRVSSPFQ